jgi:hypothetical protein
MRRLGMRLLAQFATAMQDRDVVDAAVRRGWTCKRSINYSATRLFTASCSANAAPNEQETNKAIVALRETFREIEGLKLGRRRTGRIG